MTWLATRQFATLAGVTPQCATKTLSRAAQGLTWYGAALEVRLVPLERGGQTYQVALESLPQTLQDRHHHGNDTNTLLRRWAARHVPLERVA